MIRFNSGNQATIKVFEALGMNPGSFCLAAVNEADRCRVKKAEYKTIEEVIYTLYLKWQTHLYPKVPQQLLFSFSGVVHYFTLCKSIYRAVFILWTSPVTPVNLESHFVRSFQCRSENMTV